MLLTKGFPPVELKAFDKLQVIIALYSNSNYMSYVVAVVVICCIYICNDYVM